MIVIVLTDSPPALRGYLTKWLQEISTGVYVGKTSARVREELWSRIEQSIKTGKATMVYSAKNEQHMDFRVHNTSWRPIDFDGLKLMLRPHLDASGEQIDLSSGFSKAFKMKMARKMANKKHADTLMQERYAVVVLGTTGDSVADDVIREISALRVCKGAIEAEFNMPVDTADGVATLAQSSAGQDTRGTYGQYTSLARGVADLQAFVGDLPIVCHNGSLLMTALRAACARCGIALFSNYSIDIDMIARRQLEELDDFQFTTMANYLGIALPATPHGISVCVLIMQLYEKLMEMRQMQK